MCHNLYQIITNKKITNTTLYLLSSTMLCVSVLHIKPCTSIFQPTVKWVPGLSQGVKHGRGVLLTTCPLLVPRSWKSRAVPLPTLWATPGLERDHFTFTSIFHIEVSVVLISHFLTCTNFFVLSLIMVF